VLRDNVDGEKKSMIVMSTAARTLLNAMKRHSNKLTYDACDIEWYAHTYLVSSLESWWKSKIREGAAIYNSHEWFLPVFGSTDWRDFNRYISKLTPKQIMFELTWDDNLKHVYHYLCGSVLLCDFGIEEFRRITVLAIHPLRKIQEAVEKAKPTSRGPISTPYILGILEREEQAKQVKSDRTQKKIVASQKGMVRTNVKRATSLEATLMKAQFVEIKKEWDLERVLGQIAKGMLKERFKHAIA
jgi:hypothetical protein